MILINFKKEKGKVGVVILLMISLLCGLCGCSNQKNVQQTEISGQNLQEYTKTDFVMDTVLSETIYGKEDLTDAIKEELSTLETEKLSWRVDSSETAQINEKCNRGESFSMDDSFAGWVKTSLLLARASEGAFDPTIGKLTRLWNIEGENPTVPAQDEIDAVLKNIGYNNINIEETTQDISMADGCTLDLGAVGKGIGCDVARDFLETRADVDGAVISIGGSILVYGNKSSGEDWSVAIRDPEDSLDSYMGVVYLSETACISTSGDYEKYFIQDGEKYHHILDPSTGYPAKSDLTSVTVVSDRGEENDGLLSDGLSTACFVLGREKATELLEAYGAEGIFIDKENQVYVTDGLKDKFEIINDVYQLMN